jgi:hypothetical protein
MASQRLMTAAWQSTGELTRGARQHSNSRTCAPGDHDGPAGGSEGGRPWRAVVRGGQPWRVEVGGRGDSGGRWEAGHEMEERVGAIV